MADGNVDQRSDMTRERGSVSLISTFSSDSSVQTRIGSSLFKSSHYPPCFRGYPV